MISIPHGHGIQAQPEAVGLALDLQLYKLLLWLAMVFCADQFVKLT